MFQRLLVFIFASSLFVACAGSSGGGPPPASSDEILATGDLKNCKFSPTEGEMSDTIRKNLDNAVLNDEVVTSPYFGKKYDNADLSSVLTTSSIETWRFIKRLGVSVYRVPAAKELHCEHFLFLPEVPKDLLKIWKSAGGIEESDGPPQEGQGFLAGLYTHGGFDQTTQVNVTSPTIWVYQAGDRHVIVHEMMHHNFYKSRNADDFAFRTQVSKVLKNLGEAYKGYKQMPNAQDLENIADGVNSVLEIRKRLVIESAYEEVANESLLLDLYVQEKFKFVPKNMLTSALFYIESSAERGAQGVQRFDTVQIDQQTVLSDLIQYIISEATGPGHPPWPDIAEKALAIRKSAQDFILDGQKHLADAKRKVADFDRTHPNVNRLLGLLGLPSVEQPIVAGPLFNEAHSESRLSAEEREFLATGRLSL